MICNKSQNERAFTAAETHACPALFSSESLSARHSCFTLSASCFLPGPELSDRVLPEAAAEGELPFPG